MLDHEQKEGQGEGGKGEHSLVHLFYTTSVALEYLCSFAKNCLFRMWKNDTAQNTTLPDHPSGDINSQEKSFLWGNLGLKSEVQMRNINSTKYLLTIVPLTVLGPRDASLNRISEITRLKAPLTGVGDGVVGSKIEGQKAGNRKC